MIQRSHVSYFLKKSRTRKQKTMTLIQVLKAAHYNWGTKITDSPRYLGNLSATVFPAIILWPSAMLDTHDLIQSFSHSSDVDI